MRQWGIGGALLLCIGVGCGPTRPAPPVGAPPLPAAPRGAPEGERWYLDVAILEVPLGDRFVNEELWERGDEQCVALDIKPALEENGLRVCQVGGLLPERLQALLASRRSCPSPRRLRAEPDQPTPVQVGARRPQARFQALANGAARNVELADVRWVLEVVPSVSEEGGTILRFLPRAQHGKARRIPQVDRDAGGALRWSLEAREPVEDFPEARWDVRLGGTEYIVIGARLDREGTLGPALFLTEVDGMARQQLLVLRLVRAGG